MNFRERAEDFIWNGVGGPPYSEFEAAKLIYLATGYYKGAVADTVVAARIVWQFTLGETDEHISVSENPSAVAEVIVRDWLQWPMESAALIVAEIQRRLDLPDFESFIQNDRARELFVACYPVSTTRYLRHARLA